MIVRFDRKQEPRNPAAIAAALRNDFALAARLQNPVAARRLLRKDPTAVEATLIAQSPDSLLGQVYEYLVVSYPRGTDLRLKQQLLKKERSILSAELPFVAKASAVANAPLISHQSALKHINAEAAWQRTTGKAYVGVMDFGIESVNANATFNLRRHLSKNFTTIGDGELLQDWGLTAQDVASDNLEDKRVAKGTIDNPVPTTSSGHGTHVSGIVAAGGRAGTSGVCPDCSLIVAKSSTGRAIDFAEELKHLVDMGVQVINMSFEFGPDELGCANYMTDTRNWCKMIGYALENHVTLVAAAGNGGVPTPATVSQAHLPAPASTLKVIAVGATQPNGIGGYEFWQGGSYSSSPLVPFGSNVADGDYILAPGAEVYSTISTGSTWGNITQLWRPQKAGDPLALLPNASRFGCLESLEPASTAPAGGYIQHGNCTGTSMSAPHVSGVAGLIRSLNPLLSEQQVRDTLRNTADRPIPALSYYDYVHQNAGRTPKQLNAAAAVNAVMGVSTSIRVPMFGFYSAGVKSHFYTTVPQMARAALVGTLWPGNGTFVTKGNGISGYPGFPCLMHNGTTDLAPNVGTCNTEEWKPKADFYVYTSRNTGGADLPLHRYSHSLGFHFYTTSEAERGLLGVWKYDGVEGFVHSAPFAGAWALCRRYKPGTNDHMLYVSPDSSCPVSEDPVSKEYTLQWQSLRQGYVVPTIDMGDSDDDGIPNAIEPLEGRNAGLKDNDVFSVNAAGNRLYVMQQFRDVLAREGTGTQLTNLINELNAGTKTRAAVTESLLNTPEHLDTFGPIVRLYSAYFLRLPDYGGQKFWTDQYQSLAWSFESISNFFAISQEFQQRYGTLNNGQFVTLIYNNVLNRAPDPSGYNFWVAELDSGRRSRGNVMAAFSESPENKLLKAKDVRAISIQFAMLRQIPDQGTFNAWVAAQNAGTTTQALINSHVLSGTYFAQYRARFLP